METKFHRSFKDAFSIGSLVIILFIIDTFTAINLYYTHYFALFLFVISVVLSYRSFGSINNEGMTIYYGPAYYRKSIFFAWNDISSIDLVSDEYSHVGGTGALGISGKITHNISSIKITFKNPMHSNMQTKIKKVLNKYLFLQVERISDNGTELIIRNIPFGGFERFLKKVRAAAGINNKKS